MNERKRTNSKSVYSIAAYDRELTIAFQVDLENFLLKFEKLSSLKFSDFAKVWREMRFSFINSDQQYYTFVRQFVENCFFIVKKFIVYPKSIFTEVGALYMLYSLYFKQLVKDWVKIRITYEEHQKLTELIDRLRVERQMEPLYCYAKLVSENAFEYVFTKKPLGPEDRLMRNLTEYTDDTFQMRAVVNSSLKLQDALNEDNFLDKLTETTTDYNKALAKFSVGNPGLGIFESTIIKDIETAIHGPKSCEDEGSIYSLRKEIRERAMKNVGVSRYERFTSRVRSEEEDEG